MLIASLALTAAAASKWLVAAKIMTTVGGVLVAAQPVADEIKYRWEQE